MKQCAWEQVVDASSFSETQQKKEEEEEDGAFGAAAKKISMNASVMAVSI